VQQPAAQLKGYAELLVDLKQRIQTAQVKASLSVNREMVLLYWQIGKAIVEKQQTEEWGNAVIERLSGDLHREFPDMKGFSSGNIWRMRAFYLAYAQQRTKLAQPARDLDYTILPQVVTEIPWFHNVVLVEKIKNNKERVWYAQQTIENGWSRNILVHQIESDLYRRKGKAITNFNRTLPSPQSDLAQQLLKDPYTFDFLTLSEKANERSVEKALTEHIKEFLTELGVGFAFVGTQYHLEVGGENFYLDLLFYHTRLHCYIVIDLKMSKFQSEFAGKMNFYLSAVDELLRTPGDNPSIGMILCQSKNRLIAEYALRDTKKPIGIALYKLTKSLPKNLRGNLPSIEELETEFIQLRKKKPRN